MQLEKSDACLVPPLSLMTCVMIFTEPDGGMLWAYIDIAGLDTRKKNNIVNISGLFTKGAFKIRDMFICHPL
jgi:hypothetical protein